MTKVTIGDVLFREVAPTVPGPPKGRRLDVVGDERVILLRAFYQGHLLDGLEAFVMGRGTINRTDVDWGSAGSPYFSGK